MAVRRCLPFPHACLRAKARPVQTMTPEVKEIWQDMVDTMEAMPGVGLAAPQIGVSLALAVVDASQERGEVIYLANPKIVHSSDALIDSEEASPNLPGVYSVITRPQSVRVAFMDKKGEPVERDFSDLWSISVQHQIDHLQGKLYFDQLSRTKRDILLRKARKIK